MSRHGKNTALRRLLDDAEMSNGALGRAVVAAGAREGTHVGTNTTSVRRMLDGCQPRWPAPRLVASVLSRRLHREVSVTECGFADCAPPDNDPHDGLSCSGTLEGTVRTVVELSGRDMRRRKLLLGSVFSAAAFAEPALFALTVPPAESTARAAGRRVGMADVEILTEQIVHLGQLDHRHGSGRVREQVVHLLHREANTVLHGTYSEKTGKALLTAVAKATRLAGFTAADLGRHSLAQRYYIQGLDLRIPGPPHLPCQLPPQGAQAVPAPRMDATHNVGTVPDACSTRRSFAMTRYVRFASDGQAAPMSTPGPNGGCYARWQYVARYWL